MPRVRFAPSPTGYLHIGSARTFIFNWLYARHNHGTMILRIDDTDIERNTQESLDSIFDGLKWLDLGWDEFYRQSERMDLHASAAEKILAAGCAYRHLHRHRLHRCRGRCRCRRGLLGGFGSHRRGADHHGRADLGRCPSTEQPSANKSLNGANLHSRLRPTRGAMRTAASAKCHPEHRDSAP